MHKHKPERATASPSSSFSSRNCIRFALSFFFSAVAGASFPESAPPHPFIHSFRLNGYRFTHLASLSLSLARKREGREVSSWERTRGHCNACILTPAWNFRRLESRLASSFFPGRSSFSKPLIPFFLPLFLSRLRRCPDQPRRPPAAHREA